MVQMKIRHIKKATGRNGETYYYDRVSGKRIYAPIGTSEFLTEVETLRAGKDATKKTPAPKPGTLGGLIHLYRSSPEFADLADRTRRDYNQHMDYLEPLRHVSVSAFDQAYVLSIRDKALKKHKWRYANHILAMLSILFNHGIPRRFADFNPVEKVPKVKKPRDQRQQNRAWTDHELKTFFAKAPTELAIAVAIGAYTGLREGDMVSLPLNAIKDDWIEWRQSKTGEVIEIPVHRDLAPWLEKARKLDKRKGTTVVVGARGRPFTEAGFRARFFKQIKDLKKEKKIGHGLSFHGLRHTVATRLAEAGADDFAIQTLLGHKTATMAQKYRRDASKKQGAKAAIHLLEISGKKNKK